MSYITLHCITGKNLHKLDHFGGVVLKKPPKIDPE